MRHVVCYTAFTLASWCITAVAVMRPHEAGGSITPAVEILLLFFAAQGLGAFASGVFADVKGRVRVLRWNFCMLFLGLLAMLTVVHLYPGTLGRSTGEDFVFSEEGAPPPPTPAAPAVEVALRRQLPALAEAPAATGATAEAPHAATLQDWEADGGFYSPKPTGDWEDDLESWAGAVAKMGAGPTPIGAGVNDREEDPEASFEALESEDTAGETALAAGPAAAGPAAAGPPAANASPRRPFRSAARTVHPHRPVPSASTPPLFAAAAAAGGPENLSGEKAFVLTAPPPPAAAIAAFLVAVGFVGAAVGAIYPLVGTIIAESAVRRIDELGWLCSMQGLGHLLCRAIVELVYIWRPAATRADLSQVLIAAAMGTTALVLLPLSFLVPESSIFSGQKVASGGGGAGGQLASSSSGLHLSSGLHATLLAESSAVSGWRPWRPAASRANRSAAWKYHWRLLKRYMPAFGAHLLGCAVPWFLLDATYYGTGTFRFLLVRRIRGFDSVAEENVFVMTVLSVSLIGYIVTAHVNSRMPPKLLQILGFSVQAFVFFGLALCLYSIAHADFGAGPSPHISDFIGASLLYDCFFRFFNCVPNVTTFVLAFDAFPTRIRCSAVGLVLCVARTGALLGVAFSAGVADQGGRSALLALCALIAVVSAAVTRAFTPNINPRNEDLIKLDARFTAMMGRRVRRTQAAAAAETFAVPSTGNGSGGSSVSATHRPGGTTSEMPKGSFSRKLFSGVRGGGGACGGPRRERSKIGESEIDRSEEGNGSSY